MLRKALLFILTIAPLSSASAAAIDFRLGSKTAELTYLSQNATFGYGGADTGLGVFINENDDLLASGTILVSGGNEGDARGFHFGVGGKAYLGILDFPSPVENQNGAILAIGGQMRYVFPGKMPFAFLLEGFFAPDVTSASDFKGVREVHVAFELEITPSARAYVGYRSLEVDLIRGLGNNNGDGHELDDKGHVGVRFSF